jgi:undecaprenyl-diphosphatase
MNAFDLHIFSFINQFAHQSKVFDSFVLCLEGNNLLVYVPIMLIWWGKFFSNDKKEISNRKSFILTIIGCIFVMFIFFIIRDIRFLHEFRPRPMFNSQINFQIPYGIEPNKEYYFFNTSSFPSGHAALLFALAFGLTYVSRWLGALGLLFSFIITLGRIFLGIHYPTDIISGAFIGITVVYIANANFITKKLTNNILNCAKDHPSSTSAILFFITFNIANGLTNITSILSQLAIFIKYIMRN